MIVIKNLPDSASFEWVMDTLKRAFGEDIEVLQA